MKAQLSECHAIVIILMSK